MMTKTRYSTRAGRRKRLIVSHFPGSLGPERASGRWARNTSLLASDGRGGPAEPARPWSRVYE